VSVANAIAINEGAAGLHCFRHTIAPSTLNSYGPEALWSKALKMPDVEQAEARAIAKEAYIYGLPLVDGYRIAPQGSTPVHTEKMLHAAEEIADPEKSGTNHKADAGEAGLATRDPGAVPSRPDRRAAAAAPAAPGTHPRVLVPARGSPRCASEAAPPLLRLQPAGNRHSARRAQNLPTNLPSNGAATAFRAANNRDDLDLRSKHHRSLH
jgi:hypothetical protein